MLPCRHPHLVIAPLLVWVLLLYYSHHIILQSGSPRCIHLVVFFTSKSSGSNSPAHSTKSSCCSCLGSAMASRNSAYPHTPPTSSSGQARSPSRQSGYFLPCSSGGRPSKRTSCSQPSPKSYSYLKANRLPVFGRISLSVVAVESMHSKSSKPSSKSSGSPFAFALELMQVRIGPPHCRLDVFVQFVECAVLHLDSPPNGRITFKQGDLKLKQCIAGCFGLRFGLLINLGFAQASDPI